MERESVETGSVIIIYREKTQSRITERHRYREEKMANKIGELKKDRRRSSGSLDEYIKRKK